MTEVAAGLMVLSGVIHAVVNAILKSGKNKIAGRAIIDGASALAVLPALPFVPLPTGAWGWLAASVALHTVYLVALVRAYETADFSAAYPVLRGTAPLLTAIVSIGILGESASIGDVVGIGLIAAGLFAMAFGRHLQGRALGWSVGSGVLIAAFTVLDAHGVRAAPSAASFVVWFFALFGVTVGTLFAWWAGDGLAAAVREQWRPGVAAGVLSVVTWGLGLFALSMGGTASLAALRETGMVTALLIATFVFREQVTAGRVVGVLAITAGAVCIVAL